MIGLSGVTWDSRIHAPGGSGYPDAAVFLQNCGNELWSLGYTGGWYISTPGNTQYGYCAGRIVCNGGSYSLEQPCAAPPAAPAPTPAPGPLPGPVVTPPPVVVAPPVVNQPNVAPTPTSNAPGAPDPQTLITAQTPAGDTVLVSAFDASVAGSDVGLTPAVASIRIPNIWDSLDPSKVSQFEYRGRSTSLPSWISSAYRAELAAGGGTAPADGSLLDEPQRVEGAASSGLPLLLVGLVAAYFLLGPDEKKKRAPRVRRKVAA